MRSRTFRRQADARRFLDRVQGELIRGEYVEPSAGRETFAAYAERWSAGQPWRPSTRARVEAQLAHILPRLGAMPLASVRPSDVQALAGQLATAGQAPATVTATIRLVASILRAAVADRLIVRNPATGVRLPRAERLHHSLTPLTVEQVHAVADAVPPRHRGLILATAGLGLRQGEACGLAVDRVDFLRRTVLVDRQLIGATGGVPVFGPPKTPASNRVVPLAPEVADVLAAHLSEYGEGRDRLIFTRTSGLPLPRNRVADLMRSAAPEGVTFHDLRHFAASALIASGVSVKAVQSFLGHATASETLDTYGHLWPSDDDAIRAAIGRVLGGSADTVDQVAEGR
jgi:integrase